MKRHSAIQLVLSLSILAAAGAVHAQYVWLDDKGVKQFSDMPPPANVPKNRILKDRGIGALSSAQTTGDTENGDAQNDQSSQPLSIAEKNADYMKRRAEQAEQQKKAADKAKLAADKAAACEHARQYSRSLESGMRIASTDKNGERSFMSDDQRAKEVQETQRILQNCR